MSNPKTSQELVDRLRTYNAAYRIGRPIISDTEYDALIEELKAMNPDNAWLQQIEPVPVQANRKRRLPKPMKSLNKVKSLDEIKTWAASAGLKDNDLIVVTPKFDGLSLLRDEATGMVYSRGGTANEGQNCSAHYKAMRHYPITGPRGANFTIGDWYEKSVERLNVLYKLLRQQVMSSEYIQVDESVVPVIDNEKHKTRKGYEWCVRDGLTGSLFFWYDRGSRSKKTARELLGGYRGTFQSDGYEVYEQFCATPGVTGAACWAHARRKFVDALKENRKLATQAIVMIGKLYEVERKADEADLTADERRELRQKEAYPVIQLMERWCVDTYTEVLESSLLGKAIAYTYSLMDRLAVYVNDGRINIDNNLIENAIRPLALGRKNWLFCGNDASAYRAAIVYSLLASCRAADVDPRQWLEHVLVEIPSRRKSGQPMDDLLPLEYTQRPESRPWNLPDPD